MHLTVLGLNHNTAPLDVREKIFIPEDQQADVLKKLRAEGIGEAAIISTCNRTEIYVSGPDAEEAEQIIG